MKHKPALSSAKPVTSRRKVAGRPKKGPMALSKVDDKTECMGCPGSSFPSPAIAKKRVPSNVPINKEAASNMTQSQANHSKSKFLFVIAILFISIYIYIYTSCTYFGGRGGPRNMESTSIHNMIIYKLYVYSFCGTNSFSIHPEDFRRHPWLCQEHWNDTLMQTPCVLGTAAASSG